MAIAIIAYDKPNSLQLRLDNRKDHLAYTALKGVTQTAGPFLDADGNMCGSLIILSYDDMKDAEDWAANDPYAKVGLFESVTLRAWKKVVG
jgi:uncharacterized protein YciI